MQYTTPFLGFLGKHGRIRPCVSVSKKLLLKLVITDREEGPTILECEVEKAIRFMSNNKAVGPDAIPIDVIKVLGEEGIKIITRLANKIYSNADIPKDLTKSWFTVIPKKRNAMSCDQYRTICVMSHTMKVILRVILDRLKSKVEKREVTPQFGFKKGMGTRNAIFTLRTVMERYLEINKEVHMVFIDFAKAFDTVKHEKMVEVLKQQSMDKNDINLISKLYWCQSAAIKLEGAISRYMDIKVGVRQGCVLSPELFNLYSENIFQDINLPGVNIGGIKVNNIRYADDTVLMSENAEDLERLVKAVYEKCKAWGLHINPEKTTYMIVSRKSQRNIANIKVGNKIIKQISRCNYLGSVVTEKAETITDIKTRVALAKSSFTRMKSTLTSRKIAMNTKIRLLKSYIWSVLLYGCEAWTLSKRAVKLIDGAEMWFYRRMLKIKWSDKISNESVLRKVNVKKNLVNSVRKIQLEFVGHILREKGIEWYCVSGKIEGKRSRGRPRSTLINCVIKEVNLKNFQELSKLVIDREKWRSLIADVCFKHGT